MALNQPNFPTDLGHGAPKSFRAKQLVKDPFSPPANAPKQLAASAGNFKSRGQNPGVLEQNAPGKQILPISDGKFGYDISPKRRQGFNAVARKGSDY